MSVSHFDLAACPLSVEFRSRGLKEEREFKRGRKMGGERDLAFISITP